MPWRCSCSYSPENGRSVAFSRSTAYCIGVNSRRHSASVFSTFAVLVSVIMVSLSSSFRARSFHSRPGMTGLIGHFRAAHQRRLLDIILRKNLLQRFDLRDVVIGNIGLGRVQRQVILMVRLGRIKRL